ncbi:MAG: ATP-binding protein [Candidatus Hodarchaeales archaeon]
MIGIIGKPFSGKTTISKRVASGLGFYYFSPGDVVRVGGYNIDVARRYGYSLSWNKRIINIVKNLPELTIIDGFPRNKKQEKYVDLILYLNVPIEVILWRAIHTSRGRQDDILDVIMDRITRFEQYLDQLRSRRHIIECKSGGEVWYHASNYRKDFGVVSSVSQKSIFHKR